MHPEILEDGPALTAHVATYHRDRITDPDFHRPSDHDDRGLLAGGTSDTPNGENDALARAVDETPDWTSLESPDAARRRQANARTAATARWDRQKREGTTLAARQRKFIGQLRSA